MKKIILAAALFITAFAQAQVIEVYDNETQIVNGGDYTYTTAGESAKLHLQIINVTENAINIKLKMLAIENNNGGANVQFCFEPNCYFNAPVGITAPDLVSGITVQPGQDAGSQNYFFNGKTAGDNPALPIVYTLGIIQVDAEGNQIGDDPLISFDYVYNPTAGVTDFASLERMGIVVNNTVVKNTLDVTASQNVKVDIVNLNGQVVKKAAIAAGTQAVDLSGLSSAVYFARFTNADNKTAQIKIVKN